MSKIRVALACVVVIFVLAACDNGTKWQNDVDLMYLWHTGPTEDGTYESWEFCEDRDGVHHKNQVLAGDTLSYVTKAISWKTSVDKLVIESYAFDTYSYEIANDTLILNINGTISEYVKED